MLTATEIRQQLGHFCCTNEYHRVNPMFRILCTDGVFWLLKNAEAHWLFDAIGSYQPMLKRNEDLKYFQIWVLSVGGREYDSNVVEHPELTPKENNTAVLTCWRDTPEVGITPPVRQFIEYTDFPLAEIRFYVEQGVLLLPTEH